MPGVSPYFRWAEPGSGPTAPAAPRYGLIPADVQESTAADAAVLQATTDTADTLAASAAKVVAHDLAIHTYKTRTRVNIACAKINPDYAGAIGKDFEWLSATAAPATLQPTRPIRDLTEGLVLK